MLVMYWIVHLRFIAALIEKEKDAGQTKLVWLFPCGLFSTVYICVEAELR